MNKIEFTLSQRYEMERLSRAINQTTDVKLLQEMCKTMLKAWMTQKAATTWIMDQQLRNPPTITTPEP